MRLFKDAIVGLEINKIGEEIKSVTFITMNENKFEIKESQITETGYIIVTAYIAGNGESMSDYYLTFRKPNENNIGTAVIESDRGRIESVYRIK